MRIIQVPTLKDNYAYLVIDDDNKIAAAVDPAEPQKVLDVANAEKLKIVSVLTTHHHYDHAGGNEGITKMISGLEVYGGDDRIPALTRKVKQDDFFKVGSLEVKVHFTPCHTTGHVLYEVTDADKTRPAALFTGDTLFIGGCGRFFEGTADQMFHALCKVIGSLPPNTEIYCGHEYTVKNLEFALTIEPQNQALKEKYEWAKNQRSQNLSTVPSTVAQELSFNPFMRVAQDSVKKAVGLASDTSSIEAMRILRQMKDNF